MKSVIQGVRDGLFDVAVGLFLLVLCGVSTACGRAPDAAPQESVDNVTLRIAPLKRGVNDPFTQDGVITVKAPESALTITAEAPAGFAVDGAPDDAVWELPTGEVVLDQPHRDLAFKTNVSDGVMSLQAMAIHPLQFSAHFAPVLLVNGVKYTGHVQSVRGCVGD